MLLNHFQADILLKNELLISVSLSTINQVSLGSYKLTNKPNQVFFEVYKINGKSYNYVNINSH